jgi:hypothetical protein
MPSHTIKFEEKEMHKIKIFQAVNEMSTIDAAVNELVRLGITPRFENQKIV